MLGVVGLPWGVTLLKDSADVHRSLGFILEESGKVDVVVGIWEGRSGGGMHGFSEVFIFAFGGCSIIES